MKVSVSIPAALFRAADELALRMGISRSRLFSLAIERFVLDETITAKINEVYAYESIEQMEVSVSISAALLRAADELAHRLGVSRSRVFSVALERFIRDEAITAKINKVYAHESSALDPVLQSIQFRSLSKNR